MYKKEGKNRPRTGPVITLQDPKEDQRCLSADYDMLDTLDEVDGTSGGRAARRAVRWRNKSTAGLYVEPQNASLVQSIRRRDVEGLKKQLQELSKTDRGKADPTRVQDEYAVSALEHAVRSGSSRVLDELLTVCDTREERLNAIDRAMLFAIKRNDINMSRHLIKLHKAEGACKKGMNGAVCEENNKDDHADVDVPPDTEVVLRMNQRKWSQPRTLSTMSLIDESEFSQEMTPIVMAAQLERIEIIRLLIDECCPDIHPLTELPTEGHLRDKCYVCKEQANFVGRQTVEECRKAIEVYKALSSPAYMFQSGVQDPILEAFVIADIMDKRKVVDPAFVNEYDTISNQCKKLAMDLLGLCRTGEEVMALLNHDGGIDEIHARTHKAQFPRLMVATYYSQKEFVAHPLCQQVLQNLWYDGLPNWVCQQKNHILRTLLYVSLLTIGMPFILLLYMFRIPFVDKFVKAPVTKFIFDVITYMFFLLLLFINSVLETTHTRGSRPTTIEIIIMVWLAGYSLRFGRMLFRRRCFFVNSYDRSRSPLYQLLCILFFWTFFGLKLALYIVYQISNSPASYQDDHDRKNWKWYDPFLWCETFYAVACALAVANLYTFFKASRTLGPLQISLKSMLSDVFRFLILFIVVLSAFAIALTTLYAGYSESGRRKQGGGEAGFSDLARSYGSLFWSVFGYGDPTEVNLVLVTNNGTELSHDVGHVLTETVGFGLYGFYHMFVIVVLLNMLIAMMANSYNVVVKNSTMEWRFARTRLILSYVNELGVLVPPFNLLPIRHLLGLCTKRSNRCCNKPVDTSTFFVKNYKDSGTDCGDPVGIKKGVMDSLSKRYWRHREEMQDDRQKENAAISRQKNRTSEA